MAYGISYFTLGSQVRSGQTFTVALPTGVVSGDIESAGHKILAYGTAYSSGTDFTISAGSSITVTWSAATTLPAGTRGTLSLALVPEASGEFATEEYVTGITDALDTRVTAAEGDISTAQTDLSALDVRLTAIEEGGVISAEANALPVITPSSGNPSSPYAASGLTGSTVINISALAGDLQINKFTFADTPPTGLVTVFYRITASGGTRTISFGSGFSFDGIGQAPSLSVASGQTIEIEAYTNDGGTTCYYRGDPSAAQLLAMAGATELPIYFEFTASDGVPFEVINDNPMIGAVSRVLYKTSTGSCTLNFRIADKTGSTNWAATGAASITSLSALSATTTMAGASASGANTMAKSGTTDRILQIVPTSLSGTPVVSGYIFYTL